MRETTIRSLVSEHIVPKLSNKNELPIGIPVLRDGFNVLGCGDWDHSRTSEGSVVFGDNNIVVKVPYGNSYNESYEWARQQKLMVDAHISKTTPKTLVIIADNGNGPVPIILQKEVDGVNVCDVSIKRLLLEPKIWNGLADILTKSNEVLLKYHIVDLCGLHCKNKFIYRLAYILPVISDNIMVDNKSNVWFTDNTPNICHTVDNNKIKLQSLRIKISIATCKVIYAVTNALNIFFTKNSPIAEGV